MKVFFDHTIMALFPRFFYGWRMVAIGAAVRVLGGGFHLYGFTVFFLPLSQDLGLTRAATSLAFSLARAEGALEGPLAGYMLDRFGPRPVMLVGIFFSGVGYMLLSGVNSYLTFMLVYLGVISLAFGAGFMHAPMIMANTWFIRRRALAMTLISASIGTGGALLTPILSMTIQTWGWRLGAFVAGVGILAIGLPLASFVRRSPESMGLMPDGGLPGKPGNSAEPRAKDAEQRRLEVEFTPAQAIRTPAFWMFIFATMFRVAGLATLIVHFIPIMVWKGLSEPRAAFLVGTLAFLSLPCHLLLGWLADYVNKPKLMGTSMLIGTATLFLVIFGEAEWHLWIFTVLFTTVESIFPVGWATVGDFFGRRNFGTIRGSMSFFYMWGAVAAPVAAGWIYDRDQTYEPMLWVIVLLFLMSAGLYALMVKPSPRNSSQPLAAELSA
ncbi:MAG TPA: MFS transporter [Candidatus Binatia bacterium]|nr:MFS transporter [Candidatus Binatia bacterium]